MEGDLMNQYSYSLEKRSFIESSEIPFGVYQLVNGRVVPIALSIGFCHLFGYETLADAYANMNHTMYRDVHPDDLARIASIAELFGSENGQYEVLFRVKPPKTSAYTVIHAIGSHVYTEEGIRLAQIWYMNEGIYEENVDASGLSHAMSNILHHESLLRESRYDYLTGLPSMSFFFDLIKTLRDAWLEEGKVPIFLYMNLDGMKFFNAKHGFSEGDRLLRAFAKVLIDAFGIENCCRIGSDHFAAVTTGDDLEARLDRLLDECLRMNDGNSLPVHVGIYSNEMGLVPVSTACDRAKSACDNIKNSFLSGYSYYDQHLSDIASQRQYILSNLDKAIREKWIKVYYQPIVRAVNGRVCDEEALARWDDPEWGMLSPAIFIPHLEAANQIYKLDLYVLETVLEKMKTMEKSGFPIVPHSINLSRSDFDTCDIVEEVRRRVDAAGIRHDRITIEITESTIGSAFDFMKEQVLRFQNLGFPVWMDDFGSGYSSLDVLQSIKFDLLKFDMSFMKKLDEGMSGKILLTELMKMATSLGMDTICEGVETEDQVHFLQEIGCSKLQGYFYSKPIPFDALLERYCTGKQIGYENPAESTYFETIGRINLHDLTVIADENGKALNRDFNMLPAGVIEFKGNMTRFVRSNSAYREFLKRYFDFDLDYEGSEFVAYDVPFLNNMMTTCGEKGLSSLYDEQMKDGSTVHSFARRIGVNAVNGCTAVAVAVLSITPPNEGTTYANIARALAADYYNIYYVDLDTDRFIEYSSPVGKEVLALERHGDHFFDAVHRDVMTRIYEEDRELFLNAFSKEKIIKELEMHGVFAMTYRLIDSGSPIYASLKVTRVQGENKIILGVSIVEAQIRREEQTLQSQME